MRKKHSAEIQARQDTHHGAERSETREQDKGGSGGETAEGGGRRRAVPGENAIPGGRIVLIPQRR